MISYFKLHSHDQSRDIASARMFLNLVVQPDYDMRGKKKGNRIGGVTACETCETCVCWNWHCFQGGLTKQTLAKCMNTFQVMIFNT